jgi:hypothetical protein
MRKTDHEHLKVNRLEFQGERHVRVALDQHKYILSLVTIVQLMKSLILYGWARA